MDRYQKRVLRLRKHVLVNQYHANLINNSNEAYDLAIKENKERELNNGSIESSTSKDNEVTNTIAYDDVTKSDIADLLTEKGIEYNKRDSKEKLYDLLLGSD